MLKTAETVCLEIFREILREVRQYNVQELLVLASNEVVERLLDEEADTLSELETFLGVRIKFRPRPNTPRNNTMWSCCSQRS